MYWLPACVWSKGRVGLCRWYCCVPWLEQSLLNELYVWSTRNYPYMASDEFFFIWMAFYNDRPIGSVDWLARSLAENKSTWRPRRKATSKRIIIYENTVTLLLSFASISRLINSIYLTFVYAAFHTSWYFVSSLTWCLYCILTNNSLVSWLQLCTLWLSTLPQKHSNLFVNAVRLALSTCFTFTTGWKFL